MLALEPLLLVQPSTSMLLSQVLTGRWRGTKATRWKWQYRRIALKSLAMTGAPYIA